MQVGGVLAGGMSVRGISGRVINIIMHILRGLQT